MEEERDRFDYDPGNVRDLTKIPPKKQNEATGYSGTKQIKDKKQGEGIEEFSGDEKDNEKPNVSNKDNS